jgi:hypothetical protein
MLSGLGVLAILLFSTVAILGWREPRVAAGAALVAGIVAIADLLLFFAAYSAAPRDPDGCVARHFFYDLAGVFFFVGAAAAVVSAAAGLAAAVRRQRSVRSLLAGTAGAGAGFGCFILLLVIGLCGD